MRFHIQGNINLLEFSLMNAVFFDEPVRVTFEDEFIPYIRM